MGKHLAMSVLYLDVSICKVLNIYNCLKHDIIPLIYDYYLKILLPMCWKAGWDLVDLGWAQLVGLHWVTGVWLCHSDPIPFLLSFLCQRFSSSL
jgi:hypothetical protein